VTGAGFTPPPPYEIPQHMTELILNPVELAAHAHYHLAWIHPFENVNGRMARLLLNFILVRNKYHFVVIKNVDRKKYTEYLTLADRGDFSHFLRFIAMCVLETLDVYLMGIRADKMSENTPF
jgi:Fic family protein